MVDQYADLPESTRLAIEASIRPPEPPAPPERSREDLLAEAYGNKVRAEQQREQAAALRKAGDDTEADLLEQAAAERDGAEVALLDAAVNARPQADLDEEAATAAAATAAISAADNVR